MHAPLIKKVIRVNHVPHITKSLRKAIMKRSNLEKIYFLKKTPESLKKSTRKRKIIATGCINKKRERKKFSSHLDSSKICDNRTFWKTIRSFFF